MTVMLTVIEKVIFLQNVDVFSELPTEELGYLAAIAEEMSYLKDEVIFREQEPSDALYLVLEGSIRLHKGDDEITTAHSKDTFGTWALFDYEPRVATATVSSDCRLLRITREDFFDLLSDHVQITQGVFKTLVKRLRGLLERVSIDSAVRSSNRT